MGEEMFDMLGVVLAILAFIFARQALTRIKQLTARIAALEAALGAPAVATVAAPATPSVSSLEASPVAETPTVAPAPAPTEPPPVIATPDVAPAPSTTAAPPPPAPGFEERIGTRWVVWIGGLTLALGGIFLVRYSIEEGLIGPGMRILLGALFSAILLGIGEWSRRKENLASLPALPIANIPAILTAAGTAVAFGTVYASYALYDFLSPASAFVLLGIVAVATLAAALLHGPALAGLGLVGAFVTPLLVSSERPDFWALYLYLAVVTAAAFGLARARLWRWLAITTIAFSFAWLLPGLDSASLIAPHGFHLIAGFVLACVLVVAGFLFGPAEDPGRIEPVSSGALIAYLFGATLLVLAHIQDGAALTIFAALIVASLAVAWRAEAASAAVPAAGAFVALMFAHWFIQTSPDFTVVPGGLFPGLAPKATDEAATLHLALGFGFAVLFGVAGFLAQGRSINAKIPVMWSAAGIAAPLAILIALYARIAHLDRSIPFALAALALAGLFAYAVELLVRREHRPGQPTSIALYATGSLAALALALTFALEKGWLTVALALMAPAAAWVSIQRPIPFLRWLSAGLAAVVALRLGYDPRIAGSDVGTTPIFNWLLWGYGVPALSFAAAGTLLRRRGDDVPARMVDSAAILFTTLLVFLEIRHFIHGGDVYRRGSGLAEIGLQVSAALAMAIGLDRIYRRSASIVHEIGATVLTALAGFGIVLGLFTSQMPVLTGEPVGGPFVNLLLLGYAIPAILAAVLSKVGASHRPIAYANTLAGVALVLAMAYVTLQIRRLYQGPVLSGALASNAEQYTYSVAWLAFGVVLLGAGLLLQSQRARLASGAVIALTILKAFLIDMGDLTGVWRALSFIGLGLVLVAIGWLYQRFLFSQRPAAEAAPASPPA